MSANQTDILITLNDTDRLLQSKLKEQKDYESKKAKLNSSINLKNIELEKTQTEHEKAKKVRAQEQEKLDGEQLKISERRKQISAIGGAKSAKLVERELEIAKRYIENLEKNVFSAMQIEENLEKKRDLILESIENFKSELEKFESEYNLVSSNLKSEIVDLEKQRESSISVLDERVATLYKRVESRYKGDAIAYAETGSCRCCFRALPAQTYNQIIAGYNLIQCPGCSRLLVYVAPVVEADEKESAPKQANVK